MKTRAKSVEECSTLFEIEVPATTISDVFEDVYKEIVKIANIPGFRVGKAPIDLVRKHYSKDAKEEVLKRLIPEAYRRALEEHKVSPIGMPEITEVVFEDDKPLLFKARVDTRPKFKIREYKLIGLERRKAEIKPDDVDKTIESLREMNAKYIAVEDRPAGMGDYVVSDLDCFVDGKPVHKKRENLWLFLEKESLIPGLSEGMAGMNKSEERDIEAVLPEKYPDKGLAGKKAVYHILCKEIKARQLPNIDDEFAKDVGKNNLEDLKKEVFAELEARAKTNADVECENQLLNKLMDDNVFSVPSSFVKRQLEQMVENAKRKLQEKGFKKEELDKKDAEFREKFKKDAERQVRLLFILDEIARNEKIEVERKDVEDAFKAIAAQVGKSEEEIKAYYEKEDLVDNLEEKVREEKTIAFILKNAKISDKA